MCVCVCEVSGPSYFSPRGLKRGETCLVRSRPHPWGWGRLLSEGARRQREREPGARGPGGLPARRGRALRARARRRGDSGPARASGSAASGSDRSQLPFRLSVVQSGGCLCASRWVWIRVCACECGGAGVRTCKHAREPEGSVAGDDLPRVFPEEHEDDRLGERVRGARGEVPREHVFHDEACSSPVRRSSVPLFSVSTPRRIDRGGTHRIWCQSCSSSASYLESGPRGPVASKSAILLSARHGTQATLTISNRVSPYIDRECMSCCGRGRQTAQGTMTFPGQLLQTMRREFSIFLSATRPVPLTSQAMRTGSSSSCGVRAYLEQAQPARAARQARPARRLAACSPVCAPSGALSASVSLRERPAKTTAGPWEFLCFWPVPVRNMEAASPARPLERDSKGNQLPHAEIDR